MILYGWTKAVLLMELDFLDAKLRVKIYNFRMGRVSAMEISSSQGLKKPSKISLREEKLSSQGP